MGNENRSNYREFELWEVNLILLNFVSAVNLISFYMFKPVYWGTVVKRTLLNKRYTNCLLFSDFKICFFEKKL